ncbi:CatA-like O-acetyltransferase [Pseudoalteromonas tunicata]|uniref:CatA-like O-acetyltransferase n=2 Tax=Pseudoalteromonas tunicata TaxID=314281 RepID=UPI00273CF55B|nr:CatA-like O-acetyltransferase [Pseudoalteromonas tunicata]MDP5211541.1 CatA-like O-acetyltransferase [Pseudoalteromonas tunicata]
MKTPSDGATKIELEQWPRQQHFQFYKNFTDPYFNICVELEAESLFNYSRLNNVSFFNSYLYLAMLAANDIEPFCLRLIEGDVWLFDKINANVVQLKEDETFRFSYLEHATDFNRFCTSSKQAFELAKSQPFFSEQFYSTGLACNCLHISVLPWLSFTSFSHASNHSEYSGIPKLVFGKYNKRTGIMPLSIEVHHALMDGIHVAQYVARLKHYFDNASKYL